MYSLRAFSATLDSPRIDPVSFKANSLNCWAISSLSFKVIVAMITV